MGFEVPCNLEDEFFNVILCLVNNMVWGQILKHEYWPEIVWAANMLYNISWGGIRWQLMVRIYCFVVTFSSILFAFEYAGEIFTSFTTCVEICWWMWTWTPPLCSHYILNAGYCRNPVVFVSGFYKAWLERRFKVLSLNSKLDVLTGQSMDNHF